jgi:hypothetical protein
MNSMVQPVSLKNASSDNALVDAAPHNIATTVKLKAASAYFNQQLKQATAEMAHAINRNGQLDSHKAKISAILTSFKTELLSLEDAPSETRTKKLKQNANAAGGAVMSLAVDEYLTKALLLCEKTASEAKATKQMKGVKSESSDLSLPYKNLAREYGRASDKADQSSKILEAFALSILATKKEISA